MTCHADTPGKTCEAVSLKRAGSKQDELETVLHDADHGALPWQGILEKADDSGRQSNLLIHFTMAQMCFGQPVLLAGVYPPAH